jgi:hypothetical protein
VLSRSESTTLFVSSDSSCKVKWNRLYRASENEYSAAAFHRFCDDKGPTITLVKASNGRIAGGYSCVSWRSSAGDEDRNPLGFLFSIDATDQSVNLFKGVRGKCKIFQTHRTGPFLSAGLGISDKCDKASTSASQLGGEYESHGDPFALFGCHRFSVAEYEVFGIELS